MTLVEYLKREKLSYAAFGERIGVSAEAVRRYATEGRVPTPDVMRLVIRETAGAVQPNDFYDTCIHPPEAC